MTTNARLGDCMLAAPNRIVAGTVNEGTGSWETASPIDNACTDEIAAVARSTDATEASTTFRVDFGIARAIRALWFVNHNFSSAATIDVAAGTTAGALDVLSVTGRAAWNLSLESGLSALGMEDDELYDGARYWCPILLDAFYTARHWEVAIHDTLNADGFVQFGSFGMAGGFVPPHGAAVGLQHPLQDLSSKTKAISGATWSTTRPIERGVALVMPGLSSEEGEAAHALMRQVGTTGGVAYIPSVSNPEATQRHGFYGLLSEMTPVDYAGFSVRGWGVKATELLP